jgi:hypothetical protein
MSIWRRVSFLRDSAWNEWFRWPFLSQVSPHSKLAAVIIVSRRMRNPVVYTQMSMQNNTQMRDTMTQKVAGAHTNTIWESARRGYEKRAGEELSSARSTEEEYKKKVGRGGGRGKSKLKHVALCVYLLVNA